MKFIVVGDIMVDKTVYGEVTKLSPEAPVPVINVKYETNVLGGSSNVAKNLSSMGHNVIMSGYSGPLSHKLFKDDPLINSDYTRGKNKDNVKLRYVDIKTGYHLIRVDDEDDHKSWGSLESGPWKDLSELNVDGIIISDYQKGALDGNVRNIIDSANEHNVPVFVDTRRNNIDIFKGATWMMPNAQELEAIMKEHGFKCIIDIINHVGLDGLVITKSEEGMELLMAGTTTPQKGGFYRISAENKDVVDVTGAGDTAMAAFAAAICNGDKPIDAMKFANYCAGVVCRQRGTTTVSKNEVISYYGVEHGIYT